MRSALLRLLIAALVVAGCGDSEVDEQASDARATRGDLVVAVDAAGELRAVRSVDLVTPPSRGRSRIARLMPDGMTVRPGMPVVVFDTEEQEKELRDRQSDLGTATKELEQSELEARAESERLAVDLERSEIELDKARIRASKSPAVAKAIDLQKASADVTSLQVAVREKGRAIELGKRRHDKSRRSLEAKIRKAEQDVKATRARLEAMTLKAPVGGTLLLGETWGGSGMRKFQNGDSSWSGQVVASLPDLSEMEALLFVEEADIEAVRPGQKLEVHLDAAPERTFIGTVRTIPILAESLSWNNPAKVFRVVASLDETDAELMRPGLRLQAEIEVERHRDVVTVPLEVVAERDGKTYLTTAGGQQVDVALGPRNDDRVIVEGGVEEGARLRAPGDAS